MGRRYIESELLEILKTVEDPELGCSIVDLGLVYRVEHTDKGIEVDFTLTYPGCPMAGQLQSDIDLALKKATGISQIRSNVVWSPPWTEKRASDEIKLQFGYPIW